MDSLVRFAQFNVRSRWRSVNFSDQRLSALGIPWLPQLVERAGNGRVNSGSITAFYAVLVEGDDRNDPGADAARPILDGHIVLSRQLAVSSLYSAGGVRHQSVVWRPDHRTGACRTGNGFQENIQCLSTSRDLISIGACQQTDKAVDLAVPCSPVLFSICRRV